jgi:nucleoside-diphosphate-sugar epimerase
MKKILITGLHGFVGKHLCKSISKFDFEIVNYAKDVDLSSAVSFLKFPKVDFIVHLAAKSFVPEAFDNPQNIYSNNINITLNVLEKARNDGSQVIFLSTYVYGEPKYLPIDENHLTAPKNPYTQSKLICESLFEAYHRDFSVSSTIFRPFNIYGPGQNLSFLIPTLFSQSGTSSIKLKDPRPKRDFIHVQDVVDAIILSVTNFSAGINIFNLGSGSSVSIGELSFIIKDLTQSNAIVEFSNEFRKGEVLETVANWSKFNKHSGWKPKIALIDGLKLYFSKFDKL